MKDFQKVAKWHNISITWKLEINSILLVQKVILFINEMDNFLFAERKNLIQIQLLLELKILEWLLEDLALLPCFKVGLRSLDRSLLQVNYCEHSLKPKKVVRDVFKNENENTKIHLLFANQTEKDILLREEIEEIKKNNPTRFSYMYTIDRPEEGWTYEKGFINQGRFPAFKISFWYFFSEMIEKYLPLPGDDSMVLICGPPPMVEYACLPNLDKAGHKTDRILVY